MQPPDPPPPDLADFPPGPPPEPAADAPVADAQVADAQVADAQAVDAQAVDAQAADAQAVDAQAVDAQAVDAQAVDAQAVDAQAVDAQAADALASTERDEQAAVHAARAAPVTRPRLVFDTVMQKPEPLLTRAGSAVMFSERCTYKSTANEDAAAVIPVSDSAIVLAVADGVGGLPQGEDAARITLETLVHHVSRATDPSRLRIAILDAIEKANRRVLALGGGAGTTLAVAQIVDNRIRTYHVGDSEIFVFGGRGSIKLQTLSHGPVAYGVHCGLIDPVEALQHEHRNLISNVVGSRDMRIEIGSPHKLAPRDLVLLCSDGFTDNFFPEEIAATIAGKSPLGAAKGLVQALRARREQNGELMFKDDDSTLVVYRRSGKRPASPPADASYLPLRSAV